LPGIHAKITGVDRDTFYSSTEAAKLLGLSERRIRQLVKDGTLEAERDGHAWKLFRYSVHDYRDVHGVSERLTDTPQWPVEAREALEDMKDLTFKLGRMEGRLELESVARSTLEAQLQREQERADQERTRADAERQRVEALEAELREARRSWWQRMLGA
jgi:excisionase family DNA binding protein